MDEFDISIDGYDPEREPGKRGSQRQVRRQPGRRAATEGKRPAAQRAGEKPVEAETENRGYDGGGTEAAESYTRPDRPDRDTRSSRGDSNAAASRRMGADKPVNAEVRTRRRTSGVDDPEPLSDYGNQRPRRRPAPRGESFMDSVLKPFRDRRLHIFLGVALVVIGAVMMVVLISHLRQAGEDQSRVLNEAVSQMAQQPKSVKNAGGPFGAWLSHALLTDALGLGAFVISIYLLMVGAALCVGRKLKFWALTFKSLLLAVTVSVVGGLLTYSADSEVVWGGAHGHYVNKFLFDNAGFIGAVAVSIILVAGVITAFYYPLAAAVRKGRRLVPDLHRPHYDDEECENVPAQATPRAIAIDEREETEVPASAQEEAPAEDNPAPQVVVAPKPAAGAVFTIDDEDDIDDPADGHDISVGGKTAGGEAAGTAEPSFEVTVTQLDNKEADKTAGTDLKPHPASALYDHKAELPDYRMPVLELLDDHPQELAVNMEEQQQNKDRIVATLGQYRIGISTIRATVGPTVTLYEIVPAEGVRISQIRRLEDEIAMNLAAKGVRIITIPEKGTVGIEVPNRRPQTVSMRSVLESRKFRETNKALPVALGATIQNEVFMADLSSMPHLLVAGATGQGKSVGLNAIIASLLYKKHPSELKFVLIDPKMVEFSLYSKLERHYLATLPDDDDDPIITRTERVLSVLNSLCVEMDNRYELLKDAGMRDIKDYNAKFTSRALNPNNGHRYLPYLVVVIDEFADLIMTGGKDIEGPVTRITQKGRSAGIHMIIATQRPSTNVLTGLIKANCPARIAFRVMQMVDSRTILDQPGANKLIGRGDMLYSAGGNVERVQCAYISTEEVESLVDYVSGQPGLAEPYMLPDPALAVPADGGGSASVTGAIAGGGLDRDPLFDEAARFVVNSNSGKASTSILQRRFEIGYNRAGKIMDQMEAAGIVGAQSGSKPRNVLVDSVSLEAILGH